MEGPPIHLQVERLKVQEGGTACCSHSAFYYFPLQRIVAEEDTASNLLDAMTHSQKKKKMHTKTRKDVNFSTVQILPALLLLQQNIPFEKITLLLMQRETTLPAVGG